jgi:death-on-curing protein
MKTLLAAKEYSMYIFLSVEEVISDQVRLLDRYGGGAPGILNSGRVEAAVYAPRATFGGEFLLADVFEMAAAYLTSLVMGHAFENGNKRIGLSSALRFLCIHGVFVKTDNESAAQLVLDVIARRLDREAVAKFFRAHHEAGSPMLLEQTADWIDNNYAEALKTLAL